MRLLSETHLHVAAESATKLKSWFCPDTEIDGFLFYLNFFFFCLLR